MASEGDALVAGGVCQTPSYLSCKSETEVKAIFKKQMEVFIKKNVDFLIAEVNSRPIFDVFSTNVVSDLLQYETRCSVGTFVMCL